MTHADDVRAPLLEFPGYFATRNGDIISPSGKVRSTNLKPSGYEEIKIMQDGVSRYRYVHRLVWSAFNGEIPEGYHVNHIDGVKHNNCLSNLEAVPPKDNFEHSKTLEKNNTASFRLTPETVLLIRQKLAQGGRPQDLSIEYGLTEAAILGIQHRKTWRNI